MAQSLKVADMSLVPDSLELHYSVFLSEVNGMLEGEKHLEKEKK